MSIPSITPTDNEIREKTLDVFGKRPCHLQVKICSALLQQKKHVVCSASTGFGKTLTFMMPLLFDESGIMIVITALNVLGEQNVRTLESIGIPGIALSSETNNVETFKVHGNLNLGTYL
jgi:superfamily II DNA helicase RecQ